MNWMCIVWLIIGVIIGIVGTAVSKSRRDKSRFAGDIRLDQSDPESPYLFLELSPGGMGKIQNMDYVLLHVNLQNYVSH